MNNMFNRLAVKSLSAYGKLIHFGLLRRFTTIYDLENWDIGVVCDACRYDLFREVFGVSYLPEGCTVLYDGFLRSAGVNSPEWMRRTFDVRKYAPQIADTIYVNANPNAHCCIDESSFYGVDSVWKYGWEADGTGDRNSGTVPPRVVTDRAIYWARKCPAKKLVVHYMQPHYPFIRKPVGYGFGIGNESADERGPWVWKLMEQGQVDHETAWEAYKDNLDLVLCDVKLLLECVGGKVVLTSDHGELMGELGLYGHSVGHLPLENLARVPLVIIDAGEPRGCYVPAEYETELDVDQKIVEKRLKGLGYLS